MGVSCIHLAAAFASLMFILFLSYGETTGGGVPSDAVTAHQEGYGAKEPEGEEKKDVESPELAATELAEEPSAADATGSLMPTGSLASCSCRGICDATAHGCVP